ncbi:unnamed protein product [Prorocentrum cordatum]|uniref:Uncharacterized protein n=1 Tax=Prorocentrum cordatum TaxID=2364126 RepID=A0ABN9RSQ8_9DINO|nr:unnamed protein product [Polarella glacialis]
MFVHPAKKYAREAKKITGSGRPSDGEFLFVAHMPESALHVLYHGGADDAIRAWLVRHGVRVHDHRPEWRGEAERLRAEGLRGTSFERHRFLNAGDYFGTWQLLTCLRSCRRTIACCWIPTHSSSSP